jgi:selenocysteine lyase/cysteine desulfurase
MPDWSSVRAEFPALERWTFLNSATFGQVPRRAVAALNAHLQHRDELACHDFLTWFDDHDRLRAKIARLVHAQPGDIAYVPNSATALALLLNGLDWQPGDEVLTLPGEFPNQIYAPAARGVRLVEAPWPDLLSRLSPRTRLVAVSWLNYSTGFRVPLAELAAAVHRAGAWLYIDATQGLGALEFDFSAIEPHLLAVNCYKWMLTPSGVGFLAVHPDLRAVMRPLAVGWRSHFDWRNVANLHQGPPVFTSLAEKYEGGMLPSPLLYALEAVVDWMLELTPAAIEERALSLAGRAAAILERHGGVVAHRESPILAARFEGRDAPALAAALKQRRILTSARHGHLRVSTHFYNNEDDLEQLDRALADLFA